MKKNISILLLSLFSLVCFSQTEGAYYQLQVKKIDVEQLNAAFGITDADLANIEGSPYSNENFLPGNIYKSDKVVAANKLMRYNAFADEIETKTNSNDTEYGALIKDPNVFVKIVNDLYVFIPFEDSVDEGHYFQIISEEKVFDLYKKTDVTYVPPFFAKTSYETSKPAKFDKEVTYYLVDKNGVFYELPSNKNKLIKVMSSHDKEIKNFIRMNRTDLDEEKDLIRLVSYYNSLQN
ncbi:hypothetical protein [Altibacter sp.]|uniref:hypothetical protein n=1 Tax=Altibacter sp. TaxID=2024823 RepID=UPI00258CF7DD|nr:hypothetical protein [Altibacter sp.]MCW8980627.1 hypothetical protein [Altibacter sp.]MCW9037860.1 hypothetical protein [Altibacter sp.]